MTKLPDFVNIVLTNEFEDDPYWVEGIENDLPEAYHALTSMQQRPTDANMYIEAMEIYRKYIPEVIEYYGGQRAIDAYFNDTGTYPKGYVAPPKLQMRKKNMNFAKTGFIPPKIGQYVKPVSDEGLVKLGEEMFGVPEDEITEIRLCKPSNKSLRKKLKKTAMSFEGNSRNNDIYGSHANLAARYNIIAQYYNNVQQSNTIDADEVSTSKMSISELADLYDAIQEANKEEWVRSHNTGNKEAALSYYGHRIVTSGKLQPHADWITLMVQNGFSEYARKYLKKFDEADRKYLKATTGVSFKSKKDLKKQKKAYDEYQAAMESRKADNLRSLSNLLTRRSSGVSSDIDSDIFDSVIKRMKE